MERAADLQAACAALLPGYGDARREPERWAVVTRACLQRRPVERSGELGPGAAERFDQSRSGAARPRRRSRKHADHRGGAGVGRAVRALARASQQPVPAELQAASLGHATYLLATLYANAAYKRHLAARGNAQRVLLDSADGETHQRQARQARSWGVELSA